MGTDEQQIKQYEQKICRCETMTDLLVAMSAWQSFADAHGLTAEQRKKVDEAYVKAEARLITQVKPSLW